MHIVTVAQAAAAIGLLLGLNIPSVPRIAPPVSVSAYGILAPSTQGRPLVEVFSVVMKNHTGGKPYGTITVTDGVRSQYIYNQERGAEDTAASTVLLNGPAGCISALGSFTIDVALMDDIKGQLFWNVYNTSNVYDMPLHEDFNGKKGSVTLNYAVLRDAVEAKVEVILYNGDGDDPAYVYGELTARNGNFKLESSNLFQKTLDERKTVGVGKHIPLSRSVVAVPLKSSLIVGANLLVHNRYKTPSEREISNGTAEFPAQLSGTSQIFIKGKYGMVGVKVTWTTYI